MKHRVKTKQVVTEHEVSSADDVATALFAHQHAARDAGIKPASVDQPVHLELVSLVSGTLTIKTSTGHDPL
jgi:hypothetical protein